MANVPVTFTVRSGGGLISSGTTFVTNTDSDGKAYAVLVLGQQEGINNNAVTTSFPGMTARQPRSSVLGSWPARPPIRWSAGLYWMTPIHPFPLVNHKYQLFFYLKLLGIPVTSRDIYQWRRNSGSLKNAARVQPSSPQRGNPPNTGGCRSVQCWRFIAYQENVNLRSYAAFFCPAFNFAHLARCAAAILLRAEADIA